MRDGLELLIKSWHQLHAYSIPAILLENFALIPRRRWSYAHLMALRSTLIWSTTPLSKIFSSFCTRSRLRSSITPDTYVRPAHKGKGLPVSFFSCLTVSCRAKKKRSPNKSMETVRFRFLFLPKIRGYSQISRGERAPSQIRLRPGPRGEARRREENPPRATWRGNPIKWVTEGRIEG